ISVDRGMPWEEAYNRSLKLTGPDEGFYLSHKVTFMEARESWENQFTFSFKNCSHANWNGKCKKIEEGQECLAGMRLRQYHMLCGALLRVWKRVSDVVSDITSSSILQIVRLKTKQHNKQVGIKIPENCVARVREELQLMDDEVKRRRKEKEQQERMRKMEQENKHLLSLFSQKPIPNQSLAQTLVPNQFTKHNLNQNTVQRTQPGSVSQLQDMQQLLSLQSQTQCRTLNGWPNSSSSSSTNGQVCQPNTADHRFSQFYNQSSFMPPFQQPKNPLIPLHQFPPAHSLSSKNPLDEILDLTVSPPSSSPDSTTANPAAFVEDFNLEALLAPTVADTSNAAQIQQPQIDLQHLLQALQHSGRSRGSEQHAASWTRPQVRHSVPSAGLRAPIDTNCLNFVLFLVFGFVFLKQIASCLLLSRIVPSTCTTPSSPPPSGPIVTSLPVLCCTPPSSLR
ncbi:hypothetical protein GOODEAATRI_003853, partial [Goodea atripinnis]